MGYVATPHAEPGTALHLIVRGKAQPAKVAKTPLHATPLQALTRPRRRRLDPCPRPATPKDHEYIRIDGDTGIVGITDYAQSQLGDVVYVELPEAGKALEKGGRGGRGRECEGGE